ncbi:hypothetical protein [Micromonospora sp. HUAS LYJ1]|uniref:hypothetical protein n=1 Tax=Micromonospora sp. HUAS LYJ1 TaxID=3061626 RepID=UPI002671C0D3|nr:hypothetical protein [Micromonospora sp. HUAS LYJ1]WKU04707.1 hypothetical protein Q2K16_28630 [Micromonospora sp. HUAS LYJ1]
MATGRTTTHHDGTGQSRRTVLRAGALLAVGVAAVPLTGCGLLDRDDPAPPPDPLEPLAAEARSLADRHRAAIAADAGLAGRLTPIAEAHAAHADELRRVIGRPEPSAAASPGPSAAGGDRAAVLAALRSAEQSGRDNAAKACADAPADRAALLGAIAAARATHLEALR